MWVSPVYRDFEAYWGPLQLPDFYPASLVISNEAEIAVFYDEHICQKISRTFAFDCKFRSLKLVVAMSPDECAKHLKDFIGKLIVFIEIGGRVLKFDGGSIFLPIGLFVNDTRRGSARILLDGREKVFTFSESIMSDFPYITLTKKRRNKNGGKLHESVQLYDHDEPEAAAIEDVVVDDDEEMVEEEDLDISRENLSVQCCYKAFAIAPQVIDIKVQEDGKVTVCRGSSTCLLENFVGDDDEQAYNVKNIGQMVYNKWEGCQKRQVPITNTNDYTVKTLNSPIQMINGYWKKCITKEIRMRKRLTKFTTLNLRKILIACSPYKMKRMLKCGKQNFFQQDRAWNKEKCTQIVDPINMISSLCQEFRVVPSYFKTKKQNYMRQVHTSQYGFICPTLTPDGSNIGMIRHLNNNVRISMEMSWRRIKECRDFVRATFETLLGESFHSEQFPTLLLFNNTCLGWLPPFDDTVQSCLKLLYERYPPIGIHRDYSTAIFIYYGVPGHLEKLIEGSWYNVRTIWTFAETFIPKITDLFHPITEFQQYGSYNEAPRNSLACGMIKQAASTNDDTRIYNSEWMNLLGGDPIREHIPFSFGHYVNLLVIPHKATQEDPIVVSENMVRNKFIRINEKIAFAKTPHPHVLLRLPTKEYQNSETLRYISKRGLRLYENGVVAIEYGRVIKPLEPIIYGWNGKTGNLVPIELANHDPSGFMLKSLEIMEDEKTIRYVKVRSVMLEVGDKLQTKHGNKGVVSCILPDTQMLQTKSGEIIDAYIHPAPLIKRQQIGHIIEARERVRREEIIDVENNISLGVMEIHTVYMFALKQLSRDKRHIRKPGDILPLLRQPPEGRANNGGCKLGEMEVQSFISTGATDLMNRLLQIEGHEVDLYICPNCGVAYDFNFKALHKSECKEPIRPVAPKVVKTRYCYTLLSNQIVSYMRNQLTLYSK